METQTRSIPTLAGAPESDLPLVSVIIPCLNEERFIGQCLDSLLANEYPHDRLQVMVVDGMSTDRTRAIVSEYAQRDPCVELLDNPRRITPAALNVGLAHAKGSRIMRLDAHTEYPSGYVASLRRWQDETGADNVGGVCRTEPAKDTPLGRAIAISLSHPFGVGNSYFRIGAAEPRRVDTVPFGFYRREVFDRVGTFDERLERNQDIEFNHRLARAGGEILLVPAVYSIYHCPATLGGLARQNFRNGCWNLYTFALGLSALSYRHFVPLMLVLALAVTGLLALCIPYGWILFALVAGAYGTGLAVISLQGARRRGLAFLFWLPLAFAALHLSYGLGSLWGLLTMNTWKRTQVGHSERSRSAAGRLRSE